MGRFIYSNSPKSRRKLNEHALRQPEADADVIGESYYSDSRYVKTSAGFAPKSVNQNTDSNTDHGNNKISYLKAEIDYMVDGFMRELIDYESLANLDPEIQSEIRQRYPQFF